MADRVGSKTFRRIPLDVEQAEFIGKRIDEYAEAHMDELKGDRPQLRKILNWQDEWSTLVAELKAPQPDAPPAAEPSPTRPTAEARPRAADKAKEGVKANPT